MWVRICCGAQSTFAGQACGVEGSQAYQKAAAADVLPRFDAAIEGSSPGMASSEGRVDGEPTPGIVMDWALSSGTDSGSLDCFEAWMRGALGRLREALEC